MSFSERLARARNSSKLQARSWSSNTDIEYVTAAGMVQAKTRNRVGVAASRAIADEAAMVELCAAIKTVANNKSRNERWHLHRSEISRMAAAVAHFIVNPNCTSCGGRGLHVEGQLVTSGLCRQCEGSGVKPVPSGRDMGFTRDVKQAKLEAYFKDTLAASDAALGDYLRAVKRKMARA